MTQEELIEFLKENLKIKLTKSEDYDWLGNEVYGVWARLFWGDTCISESRIVIG